MLFWRLELSLAKVVDGNFHYAPEAMTLFDYSRSLVFVCFLHHEIDYPVPNSGTDHLSFDKEHRDFVLESSCFGKALIEMQDWEERAKKDPTFMYVMPLGPARILETSHDFKAFDDLLWGSWWSRCSKGQVLMKT